METFPTSVSERGAAALRVAVFFIAALFATGCITVKEQGDRAFEAGNYKEAMAYYQEEIDSGSEDPDLYARAARTELKLGNLVSAERYYARAIRFGAGPKVAKELARYYVQTSNYASAVRVYQALLYQAEDPQPVYNNLGTALIYAGKPFDAESYLMVAQQMDPKDPLPYLNLGMLYDQHLKQPWLAINFYECFTQLAPKMDQAPRVRQRVGEIESKWHRLYDPSILECGEVYKPRSEQATADLRKEVDESTTDLEFGDETTDAKEASNEPRSEIVVERMVESLPRVNGEGDEKAEEGDDPLSLGRIAFARKQWQATVDLLGQVKLAELQPRDLGMLGASYYQLGQYHDATQWLQMVATREPTVDAVKLLIDAQFQLADFEGVGRTCERYAEEEEMKEVFDHCKVRIKALQKEVGDETTLPEMKPGEGEEGSE